MDRVQLQFAINCIERVLRYREPSPADCNISCGERVPLTQQWIVDFVQIFDVSAMVNTVG